MANIPLQIYNQDFYAWTSYNATMLRRGKLSEIDREHIAEELESMGKNDKRELVNRLAVLIAHLLKWQHQPIRRSKSWILTIKEQRLEIMDLLEESPSLKPELKNKLDHAYKKAILLAAEQTGLDETKFPKKCPFQLEKCLDSNFLPK